MPIITQVDQRRHLLVTTLFGAVRDEDLVAHLTETWNDTERRGLDELVQGRGALRVHVTPAGLQQLATIIAGLPATSAQHRVAVVTRTEQGRELLALYSTMAEPGNTVVQGFASYAEAILWLRPAAVE